MRPATPCAIARAARCSRRSRSRRLVAAARRRDAVVDHRRARPTTRSPSRAASSCARTASLELGPRAARAASTASASVWALAVLADGSVALAGDRGRIERWTASGRRPPVGAPRRRARCCALARRRRRGGGRHRARRARLPDRRARRHDAAGAHRRALRVGARARPGAARGTPPPARAAGCCGSRAARRACVLDTDESNLVSLLADGQGGVFAGGDSKGRVVPRARRRHAAHGVRRGRGRDPRARARRRRRALRRGAERLRRSRASEDEARTTTSRRPRAAAVRRRRARAGLPHRARQRRPWRWWISPQPFVFACSAGARTACWSRPPATAPALYRARARRAAPRSGSRRRRARSPRSRGGADGPRVRGDLESGARCGALGPGPRRARRAALAGARRAAHRALRARCAGTASARRPRRARARAAATPTRPTPRGAPWAAAAAAARRRRASRSPPGALPPVEGRARGRRSPRVESVEIAWREQNLPPRVDDVAVAPQGQGFREGELQPRTEPVTQTLPGGQKVEYSLPPRQPGRAAARAAARGRAGCAPCSGGRATRTAIRCATGVDVAARAPAATWIEVGEDLDGTTFTWDTQHAARRPLPAARDRQRRDRQPGGRGADAASS